MIRRVARFLVYGVVGSTFLALAVLGGPPGPLADDSPEKATLEAPNASEVLPHEEEHTVSLRAIDKRVAELKIGLPKLEARELVLRRQIEGLESDLKDKREELQFIKEQWTGVATTIHELNRLREQ